MAIKWLILNRHWLIRTCRLWLANGACTRAMGLNKMTGGRHEMQLTRQWSRTGRELFGVAEHGDRILTVHLVV